MIIISNMQKIVITNDRTQFVGAIAHNLKDLEEWTFVLERPHDVLRVTFAGTIPEKDYETMEWWHSPREILGEPEYDPNFDMDGSMDPEGPCLVYLDSFYIYIHDEEYGLIIGNEEWLSQDLNELERRLAEYAYCENSHKS